MGMGMGCHDCVFGGMVMGMGMHECHDCVFGGMVMVMVMVMVMAIHG